MAERRPMNANFRLTQMLVLALPILAGCASPPAQRVAQQIAAPLPRIEDARTRADHEEIAAWYDREAQAAERQWEVHLRMRDAGAPPDPIHGNEDLAAHCQNLLFSYELAAEGNLALAELHRRLAGEAPE